MACETVRTAAQTLEDRRREIDRALEELERKMASGTVQITISPDGAICFAGWDEGRNGITDACAFLTLQARDSWELRQQIARAEMLSGRRVQAQAVSSGSHSHDGGKTWGTHRH